MVKIDKRNQKSNNTDDLTPNETYDLISETVKSYLDLAKCEVSGKLFVCPKNEIQKKYLYLTPSLLRKHVGCFADFKIGIQDAKGYIEDETVHPEYEIIYPLKEYFSLAKCEVSGKLFFRLKGSKRKFQPLKTTLLKSNILSHARFSISPSTAKSYIEDEVNHPKYKLIHPIKDFFKTLKTPSSDPFNGFIKKVFLKNNTEEERKKFKRALENWFVSAVRTIYDPQYTSKVCLVFVGTESIGKTSFMESLCPKILRDTKFYCGSLSDAKGKALKEMSTTWIVQEDEIDLAFQKKNFRTVFKNFFTQSRQSFRSAYGHEVTSKKNNHKRCHFNKHL